MSEPLTPSGQLPPELERLFEQEDDRHLSVLVALIERFPEYRGHIAIGEVARAVALGDSFGADVDAFISHLRKTERKPDVLVPPKGVQS